MVPNNLLAVLRQWFQKLLSSESSGKFKKIHTLLRWLCCMIGSILDLQNTYTTWAPPRPLDLVSGLTPGGLVLPRKGPFPALVAGVRNWTVSEGSLEPGLAVTVSYRELQRAHRLGSAVEGCVLSWDLAAAVGAEGWQERACPGSLALPLSDLNLLLVFKNLDVAH